MASDTTVPIAIQSLREMGGKRVVRPKNIAFVLDHAAPSPNQTIAQLHAMMREFAVEQGLIFYDVGEGI